jgi:hypothetical protein
LARPWQDRAQEGLGRVPAPAALLVDFEKPTPWLSPVLKSSVAGNARLGGGAGKRIEHVPAQALLLDAPLTAVAP